MKPKTNLTWSKGLILLFVLFLNSVSFSQQQGVIRCATVEMEKIRHENTPNLQTDEEFEAWLQKLINEKKYNSQTQKNVDQVYYIPVVVHVIHDGDAVGTGDNISMAAIQSQIDVLNEDFRKISGTPGWNNHVVGADTKIEFCLAKRRPDGTAFPVGEDGVNRIDRSTAGWTAPPYTTTYIDGTIKPWCTGTQFGGWDPADYMNFWVCDISGGILGYAQFPTTVMGGMGCGAQSTFTDGVVMLTTSIGKSSVTGFPGPYNEGRTATHEIGHWLGLRHIWGDGGCTVDDYCADTPFSDASNFGCATGHNSCTDTYSAPWPVADPNDMVENYMDYSDDACMNIFTYDQMTRMRTVLENSPIRASLITSNACIPPATDDASIIAIVSPLGDNCAGSITPTVTIKNRGSNTLTSATIEYTIDGGTPVTFNWTGSVAPAGVTDVNLPVFTTSLGVHTIQAYSVLPNGFVDPDPVFDTSAVDFAVSNGYQPDYAEDFESGTFPPDVRWLDENPNGDCMHWIGQSGTSSAGVYPNDAACAAFYNNNGSAQEEYLYTPIFILPCNAASAEIRFDKAYRKRMNNSSDRLRVEMSTDCGATWGTTLFDQQGNALATGGNSNSYWVPSAAGDWVNELVDLSAYVTGTSQTIQFRFRATNSGNQGGNVYVDNFEFNAVTPGEIELTATGTAVLDEGYYDFGAQPVGATTTVTFTIDNPGTSDLILTGPINVTGAEYALNTTFGTTTVPAGGSTTFSIDFIPTGAGPFTGTVSFGTNDCDEGTYNFDLTGTGNVTPPTASFTANPTTICEGGTVTYTDASTGASSWSWTFPGGTPGTATGAGPHTITYATAGTYNAELSVTNAYGSDTDLQTNLITVNAGTGGAIPIVEGFDGGTFVPTNWTLGNGGNATVTWEQDPNNNGTAPTAGNSTVIDLFNTNTSGDQDSLYLPTSDLTGYVSAQLTFDVAYARYDGTYFDRLQVLVSPDCGGSWTVEYDKSGSTLATDPDQTGAYTTPASWRNESIDMTPYVGNNNVQVAIVAISGWGQYIYVDNVNLTGVAGCLEPDVPTLSASPTAVCDGGTSTITITGNLNDATAWEVYTGSCGGTNVGSTATSTIDVNPAAPGTTYYIRGEGGCATPASCTSITINAATSSSGSESVTACDTYTWAANSTTYTASGTYTATITNAAGCDSTATLNLTINNSTTGSESVTACDSYTWAANSSTYTASGTYTATLTNAAGCDSTATLNLTINNSTAGSENVSACDTYTWTANSTTYTASGTYTATLTNAAGCDSTATLNLTINNSTAGSETVVACVNYTWSANSTTYTSSGTYTATLTNAAGCDSTATLNLTITTFSAGTDVITACDAYTWINGTTYTSSNNTATHTIVGGSVNGCDSIVTLNLTINNSNSGSESVTVCDTYTWSANSTTYTTSGTYTATLMNAAGCDSTATLNLTINNSSAGSESLTACDSYTWSANSTTYTTSGTYTATLMNAAGCDSAATLNLIINDLPTATLDPLGSYCDDASDFSLSGGSPAGGTYTGTGVTAGVFSPATAGVGLHTITYSYTDGNGCTDSVSADIEVKDCSSIGELSGALTISPNPTSGSLYITCEKVTISQVRIYDSAGRLVFVTDNKSETIVVDMVKYARGVYSVEVDTGNQVLHSRVVKE